MRSESFVLGSVISSGRVCERSGVIRLLVLHCWIALCKLLYVASQFMALRSHQLYKPFSLGAALDVTGAVGGRGWRPWFHRCTPCKLTVTVRSHRSAIFRYMSLCCVTKLIGVKTCWLIVDSIVEGCGKIRAQLPRFY